MCDVREEYRYEMDIDQLPSSTDQARIRKALRKLSFPIDRVSFRESGFGRGYVIRVNYARTAADPEAASLEIGNAIRKIL